MHPERKGILYTVLAMMLFASMDAASKYLVVQYSVVQIVWIRYLFFVGFAVLAIGPSRLASTVRTGRASLQVIRSVVLVGEVASFVVAFRYLPLADVHGIAAVTPVLTVALAALALREKVGTHRWVAVAVGFLGVLVIIRPGGGVMGLTALIPLLAASFVGGLSDPGSSGKPNRRTRPGSTPDWWDSPSRASPPRFDGGRPMGRGGRCFCWSGC